MEIGPRPLPLHHLFGTLPSSSSRRLQASLGHSLSLTLRRRLPLRRRRAPLAAGP